MKLKITLYSVCLLMLLAACQQDGPTPEPSVGSRTVLVYMIAQNSLAPLASADIEEMKEGMRQVDATSGNLLVYIDDYSAPRLILPRMSAPSLNTSYQQTEWYKVSGWADTGWYKN